MMCRLRIVYFVLCVSSDFIKTSNAAASALYSAQPRIVIDDGHLLLAAGRDKNITFALSGSGKLNFRGKQNNEDNNDAQFVATTEFRDIRQRVINMETLISQQGALGTRITDLEARTQQLLARSNDNDDTDQLETRVNQLSSTLRRVSRVLRRVIRRLNTDNCNSNPCSNGGTCFNTYNSFICRCPDNWTGANCDEDVNECQRFIGTDLGCQNGATCQNLPGSYRCHCAPNYYGIHCRDRTDDCTDTNEICGQGTCISHENGHTCLCNQGWSKDSNGACTVDVDECTNNNHACSRNPLVQCINTPGSFTCGSCPSGYTGNGFVCNDINECLTNNGGCSRNPRVECINNLGSFTCGDCPSGYEGDGVNCNFLGPCHINNGGCSPMAVCVAMANIVQCFCRPGYTAGPQGGVGPFGCVPGQSSGPSAPLPTPTTSSCDSAPCANNGYCIPLATGFVCQCQEGYTGHTCSVEINECDSNPCSNGGTCVPLHRGFRCECTEQYRGVTCETEIQECGGRFTNDAGTLTFPSGSSSAYEHNQDCRYVITVTSGQVVNLTFSSFHLESSSGCVYDFVQIHDGEEVGNARLGRFCGNELPGTNGSLVSNDNVVLLWFHSDHSIAHDGFTLHWNAVNPICGGQINDDHGAINSPGYPNNYPNDRDCIWHVQVDFGKRIMFQFATLNLEPHSNCSYDYLEVRDGFRANSPLLGRFCHTMSPAPIQSSRSEASLHFHSDGSVSHAGFHVTFASMPSIPGCGGLFTEPQGNIASPGHPDTYSNNLDCEWLIRVHPDDKIKLKFNSFNIESHSHCRYDYLEIRDGGSNEANLVGRFCGHELPEIVYSTGNQLYLRFVTDYSVSHGGFRASYDTVCGGVFTGPSGLISSPYFPDAYPANRECVYIIQAPLSSIIQLTFLSFDIEDSHNCVFDYLEVRDGDTANSSLINRFCGDPTLMPEPILSSHNFVWLKFVTDASIHNRGFRLNFTTTEVLCGGIYTNVTNDVIRFPSNDANYPHGVDCKWIIRAGANHNIRLTFQSFHLENSFNCGYDYLDVFDNNTIYDQHNRIGRFCGTDNPPEMTSTGEALSIVFHSDHTVAGEGFMANFVVLDTATECGGNLLAPNGVLHSPNWPESYGHNKDCVWVIATRARRQIELNFTVFDMENHTNCDYDYLEIRNGGYATSPLVGRYCGNVIPRIIRSFSHQLRLRFHSDGSMSARGFELFWDGTASGCGGVLSGPSGSITSPNYPEAYHHRAECVWHIRVSRGSVVHLMFIDLDLEDSDDCSYDYVDILDGPSTSSRSLGRYCSGHVTTLSSSSSRITIRFRSDYSVSGRGFHLRYVVACNNTLSGGAGVIESLGFPSGYPHDVNCAWVIRAPVGNAVNISFSHFDVEDPNHNQTCMWDYVKIDQKRPDNIDEGDDWSSLGKFCGRPEVDPSQAWPGPIASSKEWVRVQFVSDASVSHNGFRLEWTVSGCGGLVRKPSGTLMSPSYPSLSPLLPLECVWHIRTRPGTSIELIVEDYNLAVLGMQCQSEGLKVHAGPDLTSPLVLDLCDRAATNATVSSAGNAMVVRYYRSSMGTGRGFKGHFYEKSGGCGGVIRGHQGRIMSPNYPDMYDNFDDCQWTIEVDEHHVVQLSFEDFDVEPHNNCSYDHVAIYDGNNTSMPLLAMLCGPELPQPNVFVSTANVMTVRLKADGSARAQGFKANFTAACGGTIWTEDTGVLQSGMDLGTRSRRTNCTWLIRGLQETDRVTLTVTNMFTSSPGFCGQHQLLIQDGDETNAPILGSFCTSQLPPSITTQGNTMRVTLSSRGAAHFRAVYSVEDTACGGELTALSGRIASPNYPSSYPNNVECVWRIMGSFGNQVHLSFLNLNLEISENCNRDYVEIHENDETGRLLGHFCQLGNNVTSANSLWIKFNSDQQNTDDGFVAEYSYLHHNEISGSSGQIASPLYPQPFAGDSYYYEENKFSWRISIEENMRVEINFDVFELPNPYSRCYINVIKIYDGYDASSSSLFSGCGSAAPEQAILSSGNVVFIKIQLSSRFYGARFLLRWTATPRSYWSPLSSSTPNQRLMLNLTNSYVAVTNPGYPGYDDNEHVEWLFRAPMHNRVQIRFSWINLDTRYGCRSDFIEIFDSLDGSASNWRWLGRLCSRRHNNRVFNSTSNYMRMRFVTDAQGSRTGFRAYVRAVCGGRVSVGRGTLTSPSFPSNYPRNQDCFWHLIADPGRTIYYELDTINITSSSNVCEQDYLSLRNGANFQNSPLILLNEAQGWSQNGRICGSNSIGGRNTSSNHLSVHFHSDNHGSSQGFRMQYRVEQMNCGGRIHLNNDYNELNISSPRYPRAPLPHSECIWVVMAPPGKRIAIEFVENFYLRHSSGCRLERVEVRDGGTSASPLMGSYCRDRPNPLESSDNIVYVRYTSNIRNPNIGFKANIKIATCGGTHVVSRTGTIRISSPAFPNEYGNNLDCTWRIVGPAGHQLKVHFEQIDLPNAYNCTIRDYVQIAETNATDPILGTYCRSTIPSDIESYSNEINVIFGSDSFSDGKKGFLLSINASIDECGGTLRASSGTLMSPGYPHGYPHRHSCLWRIVAPAGRAVRLQFIDFDIEHGVNPADNSTVCSFDKLQVASSTDVEAQASERMYMPWQTRSTYCGSQLPPVIVSTSNVLMIYLRTDASVSKRGFKATWTSNQPSLCGGVMTQRTGLIRPPMTGLNYSNNVICHWHLDTNDASQFTTVFKADRILMEEGNPSNQNRPCPYDELRISANSGQSSKSLCGQSTSPFLLSHAWPKSDVVFTSDNDISDQGFNLSFSRNECGGVFEGNQLNIDFPGNHNNDYANNMDCVWILNFDLDTQIQLSFTRFSLESSSSCNKDSLSVLNGDLGDSPELWKGCGSSLPSPMLSMGPKLTLIFHSDATTSSTGFALTAVAVTHGCGGVLHGQQGNISAPMNGSKYLNGVECVWEVRVDTGFHVKFDFYGRFDVETDSACAHDYLQVLEHHGQNWQPTSDRLCGRELPSSISTGSELSRLKFVTNSEINGDGFNVNWSRACGDDLVNVSSGVIQSPGFPLGYDDFLDCVYTIRPENDNDFVTVVFDQPFEIERSSWGCRYDWLRITELGSNYTRGTFCGSSPPDRVSTRGPMKIHFHSDFSVVKKGFRLRFETHECGGNITEESNIHSPLHPDRYFHNSNCTWVITAPRGKVVEIKFQYLELQSSYGCRSDYVAAFDGPSFNSSNELGRYCGNHTRVPPVLKSRMNSMTVAFMTNSWNNNGRGFRALIRFTYGELQGCGGQINLRTSNSATIRSLDVDNDGDYEAELNCHWLVSAASNKVVQLTFNNNFAIEKENYTCWDWLEVRDGDGPFSPLMGRYCGNTAPPNLKSSGNYMWIEFYSDDYITSNRQREAGFTATVSNVDPVCGALQPLNATNSTQTLQSPSFPSAYPSLVRCTWTLAPTNYYENIHVKFVAFDLESSPHCNKDFLRIQSDVNLVQQGENASLVAREFNSRRREQWRLGRIVDASTFCGSQVPHEWYSHYGYGARITFVADSSTSGSGFKLEYKLASCNRTYDAASGRIMSPGWPRTIRRSSRCTFKINAPAGTTISLYFLRFRIYDSFTNNCSRSSLQIRDGDSFAAPHLTTICGSSLPPSIVSSGNNLWFRLIGRRYTGNFFMSYVTTDQGPGCGGTLSDREGVITSQRFPANHTQDSDCKWTISVPDGERIKIKFDVMTFGTAETCESDYLELYDFQSSSQTPQLVSRYCGDDRPADHTGLSNKARIRYVTSPANSGGFRIVFNTAFAFSLGGSTPVAGQMHVRP